ncbi:hypothetical protein ACQ4PT_001344 [Festuca glaucescens]
MSSTVLRSAGRSFGRSISRVLEERPGFLPRSLGRTPRFFSSDSFGRATPIEHSSSDQVAAADASGYKNHIQEGEMSQCTHLKLDRVIESMLRDVHKLDQIEAGMQEMKKREEMYAQQRKEAFVGASVIASGIAGLVFCVKKVVFG